MPVGSRKPVPDSVAASVKKSAPFPSLVMMCGRKALPPGAIVSLLFDVIVTPATCCTIVSTVFDVTVMVSPASFVYVATAWLPITDPASGEAAMATAPNAAVTAIALAERMKND